MALDYLAEAKHINKQYQKYRQDIDRIFNFSENISKDIAKYCLKVLHDDGNPEIGRVIIESAFANHATMLTLLKCIVKTLYTIGHITRYKYGDYHALKKHIDTALSEQAGIKAELTKKKYELLLAKINKECNNKDSSKTKEKYIENMQDQVNRYYINFVKKNK